MEGAGHGFPPREFLERLHRRLVVHTDNRLMDDVAMVVVDRLGGHTAPDDVGARPHAGA
jgi:hypothetical protein